MKTEKKSGITKIIFIGGIVVAAILIITSFWIGRTAGHATEEAVHEVSIFYLDELAGRREQVVSANLNANIRNINTAIGLMDEADLSDLEHLQNYQARMKGLYDLDRFAFVDTNGLIYTSQGVRDEMDLYSFDYRNITEPEISIKNLGTAHQKVIIAVPIDPLQVEGRTLQVCFMEIDMARLLEGVSLQSDENHSTFCNIYTNEGVALTNMVLGGLAQEDNLLDAIRHADFEGNVSAETVAADFAAGQEGVASFTYEGIQENLYYKPIEGTDWMLTYLIRESVISERISSISHGVLVRSQIQTILTAAVLVGMFALVFLQTRRSTQLEIEKEASEAANRVKQEELEQRLALQEQLLEQEKQRAQQDNMITALASDFRSVYYVDLSQDSGICYRSGANLPGGLSPGQEFVYHEAFEEYARRYVTDAYREGYL